MKAIQYIASIFEDLHLSHLLPTPFPIYNDNEASIKWSHKLSIKGLRYLQTQENSTKEHQAKGFCSVAHIKGSSNLGDLFFKEDKDKGHFSAIRDCT